MKNYFIMIFFWLLMISCNEKDCLNQNPVFENLSINKKNDLKRDGLFDKVDSYIETKWEVINNNSKSIEGASIESFKVIYDKEGNIHMKQGHHFDGSLDYTIYYIYSPLENSVEILTYEGNNEFLCSIVNRYNEYGNLIVSEDLENPVFLKRKTIFKYDSVQNCIAEYYLVVKEYRKSWDIKTWDTVETTINTFDKDQNCIKKQKYGRQNYLYSYDDRKNIVEESYYSNNGPKGYLNKYEYEFDERGNWIKKVKYSDGKVEDIITREIEYFE